MTPLRFASQATDSLSPAKRTSCVTSVASGVGVSGSVMLRTLGLVDTVSPGLARDEARGGSSDGSVWAVLCPVSGLNTRTDGSGTGSAGSRRSVDPGCAL